MLLKESFKLVIMGVVLSFLVVYVPAMEDSTTTERIVFVSNRDGNEEIYTMNPDGTDVVRLTDNSAADFTPVWSPDGKKIAFVSEREWNADIYLMNPDGTDVVRITNSFAEDLNPAWSPDGEKIAFNSDRDGHPQIYVMDADGSNVERVTVDRNWNAAPVWSPDGTQIVYCSTSISEVFSTGKVISKICIANSDGSNVRELSNQDDHSPAWSAAQDKIVFSSFRDDNSEIYVMDPDGTNQRRLTDHPARDHSPAWSPDGKKIVFASNRDDNLEIYILYEKGTVAKITENSYTDENPDWHIQTLVSDSDTEPEPSPQPGKFKSDALPPVQVVVPPDSTQVGIEWVKVSYELHGTHGISWEYWIARHENGAYYLDSSSGAFLFSTVSKSGLRVNRANLQRLAESFTDFYESEKSLKFEGTRLDGSVNFEVVVKLENGEALYMCTPLDYSMCCFVPWSIEYKDKKYMQVNGKITVAVLRLLNAMGDDEELRVRYGKEIRWGCYPAVLHFEYCDDELSDDFPITPSVTPTESLAEQHILWEIGIPDVYESAYVEGRIFVVTKGHIMAIDAETRQKIWNIKIEEENKDTERLLLAGGDMVYVGVAPYVYGLDAHTGTVVWKYKSQYSGPTRLIWTEKELIVEGRTGYYNGQIVCLDAKSGDFIHRISTRPGFLGLIGDKILSKNRRDDVDPEFFYALTDITTGEQVWTKASSSLVSWNTDIVNWSSHDGILYVDKEDKGTTVAVDMETMEESVLYYHGKFESEYDPGELVQYLQAFEEGVLISFIEFKDREWPLSQWSSRIVFLDKNGEKMWEYYYENDNESMGRFYAVSELFFSEYLYNPVQRAAIIEDTLILVRKGGFIEAFNVGNGAKEWESEVRDSVQDFFFQGDKMYFTAKDCHLYCIDTDNGKILWKLRVCDSYCNVTVEGYSESWSHFRDVSCICEHFTVAREIEDKVLLVTTKDKLVAVTYEAVKTEPEKVQEEESQEEGQQEEGQEKKEGFCLGTVLLVFLIAAWFLLNFVRSYHSLM